MAAWPSVANLAPGVCPDRRPLQCNMSQRYHLMPCQLHQGHGPRLALVSSSGPEMILSLTTIASSDLLPLSLAYELLHLSSTSPPCIRSPQWCLIAWCHRRQVALG